MKKYLVGRKEVHVEWIEVEADNTEDARHKVANDEGNLMDFFEYSHTLEPDTWQVCENK